MAMDVGPASNEDDDEVLSEMNTTPLIDVLLVLLIMLIITIPVQTHAVVLNMPAGNPPPPPTPPVVVNIDVDFDGTPIWNGETIDRAGLDARLAAAATEPVQPEIHLKPNKLVTYKYVAGVLASVQHHGLTKLAVIGNDDLAE
jgi:biopolymer transport protein ExbD